MKKSLLFRLLLVLPFVLPFFLASCNKSDDDVVLDFDLTFPANWVKYIYSEEGRVMDASKIAENEDDTLPQTLIVFRSRVPSSTLGQYYATLKPQIQNSTAYDSLLIETDTVINNLDFMKLVSQEHLQYIDDYSRDTITVPVITERFFIYREDYGYNLTFVAANEIYAEARQVFDDIISSFQFKD